MDPKAGSCRGARASRCSRGAASQAPSLSACEQGPRAPDVGEAAPMRADDQTGLWAADRTWPRSVIACGRGAQRDGVVDGRLGGVNGRGGVSLWVVGPGFGLNKEGGEGGDKPGAIVLPKSVPHPESQRCTLPYPCLSHVPTLTLDLAALPSSP